MKKITYFTVFTALFLIIAAPVGHAANLTKQSAEAFVASLPDINEMGKEMEKEGKNKVFEAKNEPVSGEKFKPYSGSLPVMKKEYPEDYKKLGDLVNKHGFKSQESWAATGDDVMLAYMAGKMNIPAEADMPQLPPGMEDKMPPEAIANMKKGLAMLETMRSVPDEHKKIVAPLAPQIDAFVATQSQNQSE